MGDETFLQPSKTTSTRMSPSFGRRFRTARTIGVGRESLASYGLTQEMLRKHLQTEVRVMNFVEVRLRPTVHIQPEEIEAYYKNQLLPDLRADRRSKPLP